MSVSSDKAPDVLRELLAVGAREITCTPASLGEVFLEHYEGTAR